MFEVWYSKQGSTLWFGWKPRSAALWLYLNSIKWILIPSDISLNKLQNTALESRILCFWENHGSSSHWGNSKQDCFFFLNQHVTKEHSKTTRQLLITNMWDYLKINNICTVSVVIIDCSTSKQKNPEKIVLVIQVKLLRARLLFRPRETAVRCDSYKVGRVRHIESVLCKTLSLRHLELLALNLSYFLCCEFER